MNSFFLNTDLVDEYTKFYNNSYNANQDRKYISWLYRINEAEHLNSFLLILKSEDSIIATQGMMDINLISGDNIIRSAKSESSYLKEDFRGKGIFENLYSDAVKEAGKRNLNYIWGLTSAIKVWRSKLKFYVFEDTLKESSCKISNPFIQKSIKDVIYSFLIFLWQSILIGYYSVCNKVFSKTIVSEDLIIDDLVSLQKRVCKKFPSNISIQYSQEYYDWRIVNNPFNKDVKSYTIYDKRDNSAVAFILFKLDRIRKNIYIIDVLSLKDSYTRILIFEIIRNYRLKGFENVFFVWNNVNKTTQNYYKVFRIFGFIKSWNFPLSFILNGTTRDYEIKSSDLRNWTVTGLWTEGSTY